MFFMSLIFLFFIFYFSGKRISPLCLGDENVANSNHGALERDYDEWQKALLKDIESGDRIYQLCEELSRFGNDGDGAFDDDDDFEATAGADEVDGGELNLDEEEDSGSHVRLTLIVICLHFLVTPILIKLQLL